MTQETSRVVSWSTCTCSKTKFLRKNKSLNVLKWHKKNTRPNHELCAANQRIKLCSQDYFYVHARREKSFTNTHKKEERGMFWFSLFRLRMKKKKWWANADDMQREWGQARWKCNWSHNTKKLGQRRRGGGGVCWGVKGGERGKRAAEGDFNEAGKRSRKTRFKGPVCEI